MPQRFGIGWRQVGICFLLLAASSMVASTYSVLAVPLAGEFQPTRMVLMLTMTVLSGTAAILTPMLGTLMDRISIRKLMVAGGILLAAGYSAVSFAASFNQVLLAFGILISPGAVLIGPVAITVLISRWFSERRGRATGIAIAGISAGSFLFPMIIQGLLDANPWREALRWLSLVLLLWTVPAALLAVDSPADRGLNPDGADRPSDLARAEMAKAPVTAREVLSDPAFWLLAVTVAIVTAGLKGMVTNLVPLATDTGIDPTDAAKLISIYAVGGFVAKLNFAMLADRLGPRALMFTALGGFALGMACLTQASGGYMVIAVGVLISGLFGGLMIPIESYVAPRIFGQRAVGKAMGLLSGTILIGLLATPPLFGLIFDLTGSYRGIFWTFCAFALGALLWLPAVRLTPRNLPDAEPAPVAAPAQ